MGFKKEQSHDYYLLDTGVENIFISEYMAMAPGEYVKVYLLALMYAEQNKRTDNETIAKQLRMEETDVRKAWTYWESMGVVKKHYVESEDKLRYNVEFLSLRERLYGHGSKKKSRGSAMPENVETILNDNEIRKMYAAIEKIIGRTLSGTELMEIVSWAEDFGAVPQTITSAYEFCAKNRRKDHAKYVGAVVREWTGKGLTTAEAINEHLEEVDRRRFEYKRVLKALGFSRNATEEERRLMDSWFDEMGFSLDKVLAACGKTSGIPNPNMNYVNKILSEWNKEGQAGQSGQAGKKGVTAAVVFKYYDYIRQKAEEEAEERRREVYRKAPRIQKLDEALRALSMDMSKAMIAGGENKRERIAELKTKSADLAEEKAFLLTENNFRIDYMEIKYLCPICNDMGTTQDGQRCSCFPERLSEAEEWQNSLKS